MSDELRAYVNERRRHLAISKLDYAEKQALSNAKGDFGTYRWIQGRLAEVDDLIRFLDQQERKDE